MNVAYKNTWIHRPLSVTAPRLRLFCFPYAGGSATVYHPWIEELERDIEMISWALPGRTSRFDERPFLRLPPLLDALEAQLLHFQDRPFVFFGHSMGALVAFELCHRLATSGGPLPVHLMVSGRRAPSLESTAPPLHRLPGGAFLEELKRRRLAPNELLESPQLQELVLPYLRADLEVVETWKDPDHDPLALPITAFCGSDDPWTLPDQMAPWDQQTSENFELYVLPGDHYFLHSSRAALLSLIHKRLA